MAVGGCRFFSPCHHVSSCYRLVSWRPKSTSFLPAILLPACVQVAKSVVVETPTVVDEILRSQSGDCPDFLRSENESIITSDRIRELQQGSCEINVAVRVTSARVSLSCRKQCGLFLFSRWCLFLSLVCLIFSCSPYLDPTSLECDLDPQQWWPLSFRCSLMDFLYFVGVKCVCHCFGGAFCCCFQGEGFFLRFFFVCVDWNFR